MSDYILIHHGIKGQKWGVRRFQDEDGSYTAAGKRRYLKASASKKKDTPEKKEEPKTERKINPKTALQAKKDAEEFARAKMYYGEGAGTRRKLIKAQVEQRKKNDPDYAEEFERQLAAQDMEQHAHKARQERQSKDARDSFKKGTRKAYRTVQRYGHLFLR